MNVTFDDFKKLDIRIGEILSVEKVESADNLLKLEVDFGEFKRQVVSGIAKWYKFEELVGKKLPFIVNLESRKFKGIESQGMLVAVSSNEKAILLEPLGDVSIGDKIV